MNHFKAVPQTTTHDLRQLRRAVWSIVLNAVDRSSKTSAVGSSCDSERMCLIFNMQQDSFCGVNCFVCRLLRIVQIVAVDVLHELFDNDLLNQF